MKISRLGAYEKKKSLARSFSPSSYPIFFSNSLGVSEFVPFASVGRSVGYIDPLLDSDQTVRPSVRRSDRGGLELDGRLGFSDR